ncbi:DUF2628 domain-containing protein [Xenorhabdus littoralis]|uniref:DUF2628 domain-containing protein n=1 Tax=Xenorhabdus littoralis TaxID=2582835 RepID=UPI0029E7E2BF|nr:DUF2628 domain-containing protein [Xenorhabdus sp. psl]MDX7990641.1 DUF2628 domain-containing protein [Xenorhabdus sp. psl]
MDSSKYSEKWQERFEFFEKNGCPSSKGHQEALRKVTFSKRIKISMNFFAVFFGIFYFLILGLWKKGLALLGMIFAVAIAIGITEEIVGYELSDAIWNGLGAGFAILYGFSANYSYYLKEVKGDDSWNPFKGIFSK